MRLMGRNLICQRVHISMTEQPRNLPFVLTFLPRNESLVKHSTLDRPAHNKENWHPYRVLQFSQKRYTGLVLPLYASACDSSPSFSLDISSRDFPFDSGTKNVKSNPRKLQAASTKRAFRMPIPAGYPGSVFVGSLFCAA